MLFVIFEKIYQFDCMGFKDFLIMIRTNKLMYILWTKKIKINIIIQIN